MKIKYSLFIPFELNGASSIKSDEDKVNFKLDYYDIEICLKENHQVGKFTISYFDSKTDIWQFYLIFKKTIDLLNLSPDLWGIKLKNLNQDSIMEYVETNHFPENLDEVHSGQYESHINLRLDLKLGFIQLNAINKIIDEMSYNFNKLQKINWKNNENLEVALDIYTNSYFQENISCFLSYTIILELLKPKIKREGKGLECVDKLMSIIEEYRNFDDVKNNVNLRNEFNGLNNTINDLNDMSITFSIKQIPSRYNIEMEEDMPKMLGKSYNVRSKFVHEGYIHKDFDKCFVFLRKFIPILLSNAINNCYE